MFSFKYFLLENPDTVVLPNGKQLFYNTDGAISFYVFHGYYVYSFSKKDEVYGHMQLFDSLKAYYLENYDSERLEDYFKKDSRRKERWEKAKPYFYTKGTLSYRIRLEIESSIEDMYHDFEHMALVGRIWQEHKIVSFWNYQNVMDLYITDLIGFLSIFGDPKDFKYEFADTPASNFLTYNDLFRKDTSKKPSNKTYEIEGKNYTLDELKTMRINIHIKGDRSAEKFLCRNLTDDFLKMNPELTNLKPATCDSEKQTPSILQRYLKQGYNYPIFGDWNLNVPLRG